MFPIVMRSSIWLRLTGLLLVLWSLPLVAAEKELVIFNWSDYMDPDVVSAFETKYHVKVKQLFFESDTDRDNILLRSSGEGFDLVLVSGAKVNIYRKRGWLAPITTQQVPMLKHIEQKWLRAFPGAEGYAVPYFWGTLGIGYRKDLLGREVNSWMELFKPEAKLHGKIVMLEDGRDLVGMALKALGYSVNTQDKKALLAAEKLLKQQKPYVKKYSYPAVTEKSTLVTGETLMAILYSGDALMLQQHNKNIAYALPREGSNKWVDYFVVMKVSRNKKLAMQFLNFINEPKTAAKMAEFVYYATPNKAAEKLMPKEFLEHPVIYPSQVNLDNSEFYRELPPRIMKKINQITNDVTR